VLLMKVLGILQQCAWEFCSVVIRHSIMGQWYPVTPDCRIVFPSFVLV